VEEREDAPEEAVREIRRKVLEDNLPLPKVAREFKDVVFPVDETERRRRDAAGLKNVATRLRELLAETRVVPRRLAGEVSESLTRLLEALGVDGEDRAA
jgi:hypothetical protein